MAALAPHTITGANTPVTITPTTLGASDTLTYTSGDRQELHLHNPTGGSLTLNIDGASATTIAPDGLGATVDVSAGFSIAVGAAARKVIRLDSISAYLSGTITLTGASGLVAYVTR